MRRRAEVDESRRAVSLPASVLSELYEHARVTAPEECCGLVVGTDRQPYRRAVRCRNVMTLMHSRAPEQWPWDNRRGFYMDPTDYQPWVKGESADGERVTAVYHSHVGAACYLSSVDLDLVDLSQFPHAEQIVISVGEEQLAAGIFHREGIGHPFVGHPVVVAAP
ncbi:MAG: Mov34/MPN/PAD-1 family protein [Myxococcota bacterium]|nr:hypothetical protein [bacterium]MDP6074681.1 Mov34/MPN/PAD-1 family protein [Myxococcota bacterium]MDP6243808.1 Mov34/MPN/PAD-1 family protein [Myxococcota bacterium]MDP7073017.1 Mov34/MPN/PAD-1 family protein [Myxococcota bacterium]MDP7297811.1 Mov34/MPN/PAD-1 family protein [Myxococcota bacterium]